jgi:hypothetical protein
MYGSHRQGGTPLVPRARAVLLIGILGLAALAFGLLQAQPEAFAKPKDKVTVCHATGSATNPFVEITVSENALKNPHGHAGHEDDLIDPAGGVCPDGDDNGGNGPGNKAEVCHVTGADKDPLLLSISENAVQHHLDHGDYLPDTPGTCERTTRTDPDPDPNGNPNNAPASVVVTQTSGVTATEQSKQAARVCTSRRSFRIRVRSKRRDPVVGATVSVNGKRVKTLKGKRISAPVVLRGLPKGTFLVKITATTRKGRKISGTRKYRTCTPKGARQTIPLL